MVRTIQKRRTNMALTPPPHSGSLHAQALVILLPLADVDTNISQWQKNDQDVNIEKFVATAVEMPGPQETTHSLVRPVTLHITLPVR